MALKFVRVYANNSIITQNRYAIRRLSKSTATPGLAYELMNTDFGQPTYAVCTGGGTALTKDIVIAESVDSAFVTAIAKEAFYNTNITSVVISDFVTTIGEKAFSGCSSLTSATLGSSVTTIGKDAFVGCTSLTNITIPNTVTSIGESAFTNCGFTSINIPTSVTILNRNVFYACRALASIEIPTSVTWIEPTVFWGCKSLTSVEIHSLVKYIGRGAFGDCSLLTSIEVNPNNQHYQSIDGNLYTKDGKTLVQYAIGKANTSFTVLELVNTINDYAFFNCTHLTTVTIPKSVTNICFSAFNGCTSLTSIIYEGTIEDWNAITKGISWDSDTGSYTVYCTDGQIGDGGGSSPYAYTLEFTLNDDGESYAVTDIGTCTDKYINIPSTYNDLPVTTIGMTAFTAGFAWIKGISMPNSILTIKNRAFSSCSKLESIEIPDSVTSIGEDAFNYCHALKSAVIGKGVESIGERAFFDCPSLTSIQVDTANQYFKSIDGNLCNNDGTTLLQYAVGKSASSFTIPTSVTSIGDYAFEACTLTNVTFTNSITSIGIAAFRNCKSLTSIEFPNSVTIISKYILYGCENLTSITIPASVTNINEGAFYNCTALTNINYGGTQEQWNAITKGPIWNSSMWDENTGAYTITCTDGTITK